MPTTSVPATSTSPTPTREAVGGLRFVTASDGHLGQPKTDSRRYLTDFVAAVNRANAEEPLDFAVINGDIGHGGVALQQEARVGLDQLDVPYFVTQGNHDEVSAAVWEAVWGAPGNQVRRLGMTSLVLANTSNEAGDYLCAEETWLERALAGEAGQTDAFLFMHITPNTWTTFGVACPGVRRLLADTANLRAVFNGHDHDQASVLVNDGTHYFFDAHYGGSWGTSYRAFRLVEVVGTRLATRLVTVDGEAKEPTTLTW